jgi:S-methylmethionine-dependent homocysteine/selenocysteine methylase
MTAPEIMTGPPWLHERITAGRVVLIDGATGTELERRGVPMNSKAWCGDAVLGHAQVLREIHEDYIRAGASVIIANTYASARQSLEPAGLGDQVERVNRRAVEVACEARERAARGNVAVAGSMSDNFGDPENPYWRREQVLRATFREQAEILAVAGVDLIAMEMMQEPEVALPAIEAALGTGLPVWVGCSCRQNREGAPLGFFDFPDRGFQELVDAIVELPIGVVTIMHSEVPDVDAGIDAVRARWQGPLGVYPESGYFVMPHWQFVDIISPDDLVAGVQGWIRRGVRIVGGCCGIGPEHIEVLNAALDGELRP